MNNLSRAGAPIEAQVNRDAWPAALKVNREIEERLREGGPEVWEGRVCASGKRKIALALGAVGPAMGR